MSAPLVAESVGYRIGAAVLAEDLTLSLEAGRVIVVVGPNGAGKSTLVKLLSGEIVTATGRVVYGEEDVRAIPPWRLACLRAVLPQASHLAFPFTAGEIVRIGLDGVGRGLSRADRAAIAAQALEEADVVHLAERMYQSLSGGEQQRTQFARIFAQLAAGQTIAGRQVLLLDEPIASLDLQHQLSLLDAARRLAAQGVAVLAVLHDLNLAAAFADEILVMSKGRAVARGTPTKVITTAMIGEVFGVDIPVGSAPVGMPFLLPRRR